MPTLLEVNGYKVRIFTEDHDPPHVHVWKAGNEARIELADPPRVMDTEMSSKDTKKAVQIVSDNLEFLLGEWDKIHNQ